ncbi:hypothetical protein J3Q64DRAFT_1706193 [Phycomyces blakesleeanus]|uniref:Uncharacterized protein n=2 Tax=Phycomyces blakesleeanus TaxID=4837 RepID=A0A163EBS0_PHYB8|nr:hypothetical protein PHYBLDRAFT_164718 [Phycomyces blakesleeanus NRRL 1555(-)]OAD77830.1 hypothetical protein PHYBLDRAFT_164718 [Phycomyces blakesleeanus NRRL 1555(-)]|eukprot:XP_018295870.1 hypothetical protein PHYBLDRAFT_164718 [Phycomyces blakesleeanus NRRL 1555(-)]
MNLYFILFILATLSSQTISACNFLKRSSNIQQESCIEIIYPAKRVTWETDSFHTITWKTNGKCSQPKSIFLIDNAQQHKHAHHVALFHQIDVSLGYVFVFIPTRVKQTRQLLAIGTEGDNGLVTVDSVTLINIVTK